MEQRDYSQIRYFTLHLPKRLFMVYQMILTSEKPDEDFPLILTTGRIRDQWHTMSKTGKVNKLKQHISKAYRRFILQMQDAWHITDESLVLVKSRRGEVRVKARISAGIKKGVVFLPMHWGKILGNDLNRANNITSDLVDPLSKEPDFKFCAVRLKNIKSQNNEL